MTELSPREILGLEKVGDAYCPYEPEIPSFQDLRCAENACRVLDYVPETDLKDLKMLLRVLGFMPGILITLCVVVMEIAWERGFLFGSTLKQIRLGLRGIVFSLYYSTPAVQKALGYEVKVSLF